MRKVLDLDQVKRLLAEGHEIADIAEAFGVTRDAVRLALKRAGVEYERSPKFNEKILEVDQIKRFLAEGYKKSEIARFFGVTTEAVLMALKRDRERGLREAKREARRAIRAMRAMEAIQRRRLERLNRQERARQDIEEYYRFLCNLSAEEADKLREDQGLIISHGSSYHKPINFGIPLTKPEIVVLLHREFPRSRYSRNRTMIIAVTGITPSQYKQYVHNCGLYMPVAREVKSYIRKELIKAAQASDPHAPGLASEYGIPWQVWKPVKDALEKRFPNAPKRYFARWIAGIRREAKRSEIVEMYQAGHPIKRITRALGISKDKVKDALYASGLWGRPGKPNAIPESTLAYVYNWVKSGKPLIRLAKAERKAERGSPKPLKWHYQQLRHAKLVLDSMPDWMLRQAIKEGQKRLVEATDWNKPIRELASELNLPVGRLYFLLKAVEKKTLANSGKIRPNLWSYVDPAEVRSAVDEYLGVWRWAA